MREREWSKADRDRKAEKSNRTGRRYEPPSPRKETTSVHRRSTGGSNRGMGGGVGGGNISWRNDFTPGYRCRTYVERKIDRIHCEIHVLQ